LDQRIAGAGAVTFGHQSGGGLLHGLGGWCRGFVGLACVQQCPRGGKLCLGRPPRLGFGRQPGGQNGEAAIRLRWFGRFVGGVGRGVRGGLSGVRGFGCRRIGLGRRGRWGVVWRGLGGGFGGLAHFASLCVTRLVPPGVGQCSRLGTIATSSAKCRFARRSVSFTSASRISSFCFLGITSSGSDRQSASDRRASSRKRGAAAPMNAKRAWFSSIV